MEVKKLDSMDSIPPDGCCAFFLPKKRRFCKFRPNTGQKYCAEHACVMGVQLERKRIPCPLDPKHTCYEDSLEKHLKKCNKSVTKNAVEGYHQQGINAGNDDGDAAPQPKVTVCTVKDEELQILIDRVNKLYNEHIQDIKTDILSHSCLREELENPSYGTPALRHRKQQASLVGHLDKLQLLKDGVCFVEMGAGKGQLSHWVQRAVEKCDKVSFVLVDRGTIRYKLDNQHREEQGPKFERLRIDIEHLNLGKYNTISADDHRPVVAMGKHLCGAATDLALRCLLETLPKSDDNQTCEQSPSKKPRTEHKHRLPSGVVIALCCHHRCTWKAYVGKEFMKHCGISARDFQLLSSMSSWATCTWKGWRKTGIKQQPEQKDRPEEDVGDSTADEHDIEAADINSAQTSGLKLSETEREEIGRRCKRLIDYGRIKYLQHYQMDSNLREYIDHHLTPENIVLIAKPFKD
ncbi:tRNA:m(4)X modification enzyme TRM13 homolog isoform X1 [Haliotis rufescens]|uniref:tRNA:m(4)X modification enzyme TRM13 homolog isoform X1 n=1 Tax=Haliotis rufescens TaxID=6454 RepID=UPI001EB08E83|nr:tRNA:m(4)X modification enzyme TRM13 homolog isoform X1 [Haliotis rufescens]